MSIYSQQQVAVAAPGGVFRSMGLYNDIDYPGHYDTDGSWVSRIGSAPGKYALDAMLGKHLQDYSISLDRFKSELSELEFGIDQATNNYIENGNAGELPINSQWLLSVPNISQLPDPIPNRDRVMRYFCRVSDTVSSIVGNVYFYPAVDNTIPTFQEYEQYATGDKVYHEPYVYQFITDKDVGAWDEQKTCLVPEAWSLYLNPRIPLALRYEHDTLEYSVDGGNWIAVSGNVDTTWLENFVTLVVNTSPVVAAIFAAEVQTALLPIIQDIANITSDILIMQTDISNNATAITALQTLVNTIATDVAQVILDVANKIDKVPTATAGNLAVFDANGGLVDGGTIPVQNVYPEIPLADIDALF